MPQDEVDFFQKDQIITLQGYTSTSKDLQVALQFSLDKPMESLASIVYEINFYGNKGLFEMSSGFSFFDDEEEILV